MTRREEINQQAEEYRQPYRDGGYRLSSKDVRDAYWKIAGDEMELGKPWEPDYTKERYIIYKWVDEIFKGYKAGGLGEHFILEFPTKEMRDAFKENFDPELKFVKSFCNEEI